MMSSGKMDTVQQLLHPKHGNTEVIWGGAVKKILGTTFLVALSAQDINYEIDEYDNVANDFYDDTAWQQMQYKINKLPAQLEDEAELNVRGIPFLPSRHRSSSNCVEKYHGPFPTQDVSDSEEIYPPVYYNVTCDHYSNHYHNSNHDTGSPIIHCDANKKHTCKTIVTRLPVFKKVESHRKSCWKLVAEVPVQTGCKCS